MSAAGAVALVGLERVAEWIETTARLGAATWAVLSRAHGSQIERRVLVFVLRLQLHTSEKRLKNISNKDSLNDAGVLGTVVGVQVVTGAHERVNVGGRSSDVLDLPGDALGLVGLVGVNHSAIVALVEELAEAVNLVERLAFAFSVVFFEVAPAAVLVDGLQCGPEEFAEGSLSGYGGVHF